MTLAYIRPDKNFDSVHEQLQLINSYIVSNNITVDDEFIDQNFQSQRVADRTDITSYFQSKTGANLLVADVWVLSTNMEDIIQMFSCLLKNNFKVHFIKQSVTISKDSSSMLILGLMDQLRQTIQNDFKREIGRPKGSRSVSKFDKYTNEILSFIKEKKSVSEMARVLGVSRSSLKDYIESRELKLIALDTNKTDTISKEKAEEVVINTIDCPK